ncbi:type IV pilus modification protein PilV, partial [Neisseria dentiae]
MRKTLYPNHPHENAAIRTAAGSKGRLKQNQSGMTLVEVLVAMFVLAVGVLALLATQLRTVSSVREAESQTVVAQAVQNLM